MPFVVISLPPYFAERSRTRTHASGPAAAQVCEWCRAAIEAGQIKLVPQASGGGRDLVSSQADADRASAGINDECDGSRIALPLADGLVQNFAGLPHRCVACQGVLRGRRVQGVLAQDPRPVHDVDRDAGPDLAGQLQDSREIRAGQGRDFVVQGQHDSSSSVGGAASAARVIGGSEQPTEEAPTCEAGSDPSTLAGCAQRSDLPQENLRGRKCCLAALGAWVSLGTGGRQDLLRIPDEVLAHDCDQCIPQMRNLRAYVTEHRQDVRVPLVGVEGGKSGPLQGHAHEGIGVAVGDSRGGLAQSVVGDGAHDSSSSVGGDAAQAASVVCTPEPTEEAPSLSEGEERRLREERAWAAWDEHEPRVRALGEACRYASDTQGWPQGALEMAACVKALFDDARRAQVAAWRAAGGVL